MIITNAYATTWDVIVARGKSKICRSHNFANFRKTNHANKQQSCLRRQHHINHVLIIIAGDYRFGCA